MVGSRFSPSLVYALDALGWLQFDRLCEALLEADAGVAGLDWRGDSDTRRVARLEEGLVFRGGGTRLVEPVTVAALWVREDQPPSWRLSELVDRVGRLLSDSDVEREVVLLTNLHVGAALAALRALAFARRRQLIVLDGRQISTSLDRYPALRAAVPSVLGLRDLEPLIDPTARARSSFDVTGAQVLARVFWATRAYELARIKLGRYGFVVLTGPPEMGKTAIARMVALAQLTDGWEAHECNAPDEVWRAFDPGRRQVFIADDAFGSTEYRPDAAERWARGLGQLLTVLNREHWLIWTSRPAPLKAGLRRVQSEHGSERFPAPGEVLVDASDLDLVEKTLILFRHAKAGGTTGMAREVLRSTALSIVEHPHFTPERIRRFVSDGLPQLRNARTHAMAAMIERELASPTDAMRNSFAALEQEHRDLLTAMLDAPAGLIDERELAVTVRRHHAGGLSRAPGELIDRLTDHFLRITPLGIGWVHPSWRDLVIDELRHDAAARLRFLAACGIHGIMLALSQQGGATGERTMPLLASDADWDQVGDRVRELLRELDDADIARVLLALANATALTTNPQQQREAQSLAVYALEATQRAWDTEHRVLPSFLIEAWYELRHHAAATTLPPQLLKTWVELHPGSSIVERPVRSGLVQAEEWLSVAHILSKHDPSALRKLGFPGRDMELLERLVVTLSQAATFDEELRPLAENLLALLATVVPQLATGAQGVIEIARLVEQLEQKRWWVPTDIATPPSNEIVTADVSRFRRDDVDRVLSDL